MSIKNIIKKIDSKKDYNISHLVDDRLFPHIEDRRTIRKIIDRDIAGTNILKVEISGEGTSKEYKIKGKNIINFLNRYGAGMELRVKANKKNYENKEEGKSSIKKNHS